MNQTFDYVGNPARIIFGNGSLARVGEMIRDLGCKRALVLSTPFQSDDAQALADQLGELCVGTYTNATMHTPVNVTDEAMAVMAQTDADCTVALGGGSTTGLGKAIAYRTDFPQIVIPTTYAGSEVTPILGQTENELKTTIKDPKILPEVVIYDPSLTVGLPLGMTTTSAFNAVAHAVEALYARDRNPITSLMAGEGIKAILRALPVLRDKPDDLDARSDALYGAWLCGSVLGQVGMALHHKLCHILGGTFDLPHAETHAVILPHVIAYNAAEVPELLAPVAEALGVEKPGLGLFEYAKSINAPTTLKELGMPEDGIDKAVELVFANAYWNPRELDRELIRRLLEKAYHGIPPAR